MVQIFLDSFLKSVVFVLIFCLKSVIRYVVQKDSKLY